MSRAQAEVQEAHVRTLYYMPHCERNLTEKLLQANWDSGTLRNVVILGNSFHQYLLNLTAGEAAASRVCKALTSQAAVEAPLVDLHSPRPNVFNNFALQAFPKPELAGFDGLPPF